MLSIIQLPQNIKKAIQKKLKKHMHQHHWSYQKFNDSNRTERNCNCGAWEENRPEIDEVFGQGNKVWYAKNLK